MSTTVEEFLREAQKLTPEERRELAEALLKEGKHLADRRDEEEERTMGGEIRQRRLEWLKAHRAEYGGQHVALDGAALVAAGRSYREAKENALSAGKSDVFITYLPKPDEVAEWGGW
ncbi:MAG: hypothetical protein QOC61_967 [Acidobacteriota bacterium]|jgi:hypothetical protein|nr:hypothetical protein [Acidobacteriota bacterium]